jgi:hypothetical protein
MYAKLVLLGALCALALPAASAGAADPIAVNQSARQVSALDGNLVFERKQHGKWLCMRSVGGKVSVAHGVPAPGCQGRMALDSKGRVVLQFFRERVRHGKVLSVRRYLYDVKRDRVRRVTGLPAGMCEFDPWAIWGRRTVYGVNCSSTKRNGLWLKDGKKTQRILASSQGVEALALRGGTLAGQLDLGAQDYQRYLLAVGGKRCVRAIDGSTANLETEDLAGLWVANGSIVWSTGYFRGDTASMPSSPYRAFLASKVPSHCATPGPTGRYEFNPETSHLTSFDLDGRQLYYAGYDGIRRHTFPAQPSYAPPPNDNFENAQSLAIGTESGLSSTAWATTQPGEPLAGAKQTIWYTFTAATSETHYVSLSSGGRNVNELNVGVYSGTSLATLAPVAGPSPGAIPLQFDAVAGKQYWIDIGSADAQANFLPFGVQVRTAPS